MSLLALPFLAVGARLVGGSRRPKNTGTTGQSPVPAFRSRLGVETHAIG